MLQPASGGTPTPSPPSRLQDKAQVLSDVRGIIAEQLGTDLDKVRREGRGGAGVLGACRRSGTRARASLVAPLGSIEFGLEAAEQLKLRSALSTAPPHRGNASLCACATWASAAPMPATKPEARQPARLPGQLQSSARLRHKQAALPGSGWQSLAVLTTTSGSLLDPPGAPNRAAASPSSSGTGPHLLPVIRPSAHIAVAPSP